MSTIIEERGFLAFFLSNMNKLEKEISCKMKKNVDCSQNFD